MVNQKGGVGKTTTAVNLAAALAERGERILLIDLDPQSNSTSALGLDPRWQRRTIYDVLSGGAEIGEVITATVVAGLDLVPSQLDLAGAEIELATGDQREHRLRLALAALPPGYRMVLIDCPPSLALLTLNALTAADEMLIPLQAEYFALEGLGHLLYTQQLVRANLNPKLEVGGILVTLFDGRTTLAWDVAREVRRSYPHNVYRTMIPRNVRVSEAPSHGLPITLYDPGCRGAHAYRELAQEVLNS
ncbi:MAG TPA: ParA family protein [Candidatus Dormibacteraeota bacterium]